MRYSDSQQARPLRTSHGEQVQGQLIGTLNAIKRPWVGPHTISDKRPSYGYPAPDERPSCGYPTPDKRHLYRYHTPDSGDWRAPPESQRTPRMKSTSANCGKVAVVLPQVLRGYPGQFMIRRPDTADSDAVSAQTLSSRGGDDARNELGHSNTPRMKTDSDLTRFSDKDYMMPSHVRDILLEEGVSNMTVEAWLQHREVCHKRAQALRHSETSRVIKARVSSHLPPLHQARPLVVGDVETEQRHLPQPDPVRAEPVIPEHVVTESQLTEHMERSEDGGVKEEMESGWLLEQEEERLLMVGLTRPRLVLISSKIPRCHSMSRAVKKDGHVLHVIYDFDSWSFDDIIGSCRLMLDTYKMGSKAQSVLIFCKGGPGYIYMLRNYVLTPQKMGLSNYRCVRNFWNCLGQLVSKLTPESACVHIIGEQLERSGEGAMLKQTILEAIWPNKVTVESLDEEKTEGRKKIGLYFNYRKYLLWRARTDNPDDVTNALS
ncbi:unnamed protein product [Lymnaea stagnalis]|uniref:Uncharacterized protein n=1 Tax=Lymnaea stagnalis TaxID=6523 RepID=A0AAV2H7X4_LYMST